MLGVPKKELPQIHEATLDKLLSNN